MVHLPKKFGPYRVMEPLGRGGMGVVYRAEHTRNREQVALKTVVVPKEGNVAGLRREIHALSRIRHPGIVRIVEEGLQDGVPWYAMSLLEGETLRQYSARRRGGEAAVSDPTDVSSSGWWTSSLGTSPEKHRGLTRPAPRATRTRGRMQLRPILTLVRRLCNALALLHGEGLVHRDLKPDNVLVQRDGRPVIVDFGLTSRFGGTLSREELDVRSAGEGTLAYMAPEQHVQGLVDARADLYSLGCILYELVTGALPFEPAPTRSLTLEQKASSPVPPSQRVPGLGPELDDLVLQLLAFEPRHRIGHADLVAETLTKLGAAKDRRGSEPQPNAYLYRPRTVGREEQMRLAEGLVASVHDGTGGVMFIGGESGVGKTRLLTEMAQHGRRAGLLVLTGECVLEGGGPLQALRRPLQQIADRCRESGAETTERVLGQRGKILSPYEPSLAALPGQAAHSDPTDLPPKLARARLFRAAREVLSSLSEQSPVALVLDDLQWIDELSFEFLEHVVGSELRESRLLLIGAYRSDEAGRLLQRLLRAPGVVHSKLGRLTLESVGMMVGDMLALERPPAPFVQFLDRQSEGNPFFVAEYLRTAVAEKVLYRDRTGRWQGIQRSGEEAAEEVYDALPLPRSVRELVGRRLDGLAASARRLVDTAAVLGRQVDRSLLAGVADVGDAETLQALNELLVRQILEEIQTQHFRFSHDKIREVAYERIGRSLRRRLHAAAAEALEGTAKKDPGAMAATIAYHWSRAGHRVNARQWYVTAARHARLHQSLGEAERLYRSSIRLYAKPQAATISLRNELGFDVLRIQGRNRQAIQEHRKALRDAEMLTDRAGMAASLRGLGWNHYALGRLEEADHFYAQALPLARETNERELESSLLSCMAVSQADRGAHGNARQLYEEAIAIDRQRHDRLAEANNLGNLAVILATEGRLEDAAMLLERAVAQHREIRNRRGEAVALTNLTSVFQQRGQLSRAVAVCHEALAIHRETGNRPFEGVTLSNLAELYAETGPCEQARSLYEQALVIHRELRSRRFEGITLCDWASLERRSGALARASELLREAGPILRKVRDALNLGVWYCERGHLALSEGRASTRFLNKARALVQGLGAGPESKLSKAISTLERAASRPSVPQAPCSSSRS